MSRLFGGVIQNGYRVTGIPTAIDLFTIAPRMEPDQVFCYDGTLWKAQAATGQTQGS